MINIVMTAACLLCVCGLLLAEHYNNQPLKWAAKPAASVFFVLLAVASGAAETGYGLFILTGLVLCLAGDILLIPQNEKSFLAGMAAFALGHGAYIAAFTTSAERVSPYSAIALTGMIILATLLLWRLWPRLAALKWPVTAYSAIIAIMVATSFSAAPNTHQTPIWPIAVGATLFAASDIAVARDQFVERNFFNRLWGLPLYYVAQLLIAASV